MKLTFLNVEYSNLLQAFQECQTKKKLNVRLSIVTLEEILQKYAWLDELEVKVDDGYPVRDQHEANATIHQLKVLNIGLWTIDEKIQGELISSILKLNNLQQFNFNSKDYNGSYNSLSQSLCQQLAAHICQLKSLTILMIVYDKNLLEEVIAFAANFRVANTSLEEFKCDLSYFKSLPSSSLGHFTNLRKLDIDCFNAEETKVEDLISFMDKSQLTSITLGFLPPAYFQQFQHLQVDSLQVLEIKIHNMFQDKVPVLEILQEFLPRHPNITHFEITFWNKHDESNSLELVPMILATLTKLERLVVGDCLKITADVIKQIAVLETLKSWKINEHKSETFYKS